MSTNTDHASGDRRVDIVSACIACLFGFALVWSGFWILDALTARFSDAGAPLLFRIGVWGIAWWPVALPLAIIGCVVLLRSRLRDFVRTSGTFSPRRCAALGSGLAAFIGFAVLGPFAMQNFPDDAPEDALISVTVIAALYGFVCGTVLAGLVNRRQLNHAH